MTTAGWARGGASRSGPGLPERGWGASRFGFESVPGGFLTGSTSGPRGRPKERRPRKGKKSPQKPARHWDWGGPREGCGEAHAPIRHTKDLIPIQCGGHCRALALLLRRSHSHQPITVLRLDMWRVVLHLRGRSTGVVWGDLALRRFNVWRASAGGNHFLSS
jgi:hypothetical protein